MRGSGVVVGTVLIGTGLLNGTAAGQGREIPSRPGSSGLVPPLPPRPPISPSPRTILDPIPLPVIETQEQSFAITTDAPRTDTTLEFDRFDPRGGRRVLLRAVLDITWSLNGVLELVPDQEIEPDRWLGVGRLGGVNLNVISQPGSTPDFIQTNYVNALDLSVYDFPFPTSSADLDSRSIYIEYVADQSFTSGQVFLFPPFTSGAITDPEIVGDGRFALDVSAEAVSPSGYYFDSTSPIGIEIATRFASLSGELRATLRYDFITIPGPGGVMLLACGSAVLGRCRRG